MTKQQQTTMSNTLIVKRETGINAPAEKVWDVLTQAQYIRQWDDLPEGFSETSLGQGSVIDWEGYSRLTVTVFEPNRHLKQALHLPKVKLAPGDYDISYSYRLTPVNGHTQLAIEIGDFSPIPNGEDYYEASLEFAEEASEKIKKLAEQ